VLQRLDGWLRRRLRQVRWKERKHVRSKLRTCCRQAFANAKPAMGRTRARATGASQTLQSLPAPCPTPTGLIWASKGSTDPPRFPGMLSEPPDADPHVRSYGGRRGEPGAYPLDRSTSHRLILQSVVLSFRATSRRTVPSISGSPSRALWDYCSEIPKRDQVRRASPASPARELLLCGWGQRPKERAVAGVSG